MKFYVEVFKLIINKFIFRKDTGTSIRRFSERMGIVYIKAAQMLATQNYGNLFTEDDRRKLSSICDNCNPIEYGKIEEILRQEYKEDLNNIFEYIEKEPIGSASVSQVHKATLKNGDEVVIKIKRKDITDNIDKEINRIRKLVHKYGKFMKFGNYGAGDQALNFLLDWIKQETDFNHERKNIGTYQEFANNVNNRVKNTKKIKIPKLYNEYCTDNIIVMEFINNKTINKMEPTEENNAKIREAFNSYIKLSFWALFNNQKIVFHGDPHSGNIYIDDNGDMGFLDMGLLFELNNEDSKLLKKFFIAAYLGDCEELYNIIAGYSSMSDEKKKEFKEDCEIYCKNVKTKNITYYFMDMVNVCYKYEVLPPDFLFAMTKAFVCLNGISIFTNNEVTAFELVGEQAIEYLLREDIKKIKKAGVEIYKSIPNLVKNAIKEGPINAVATETSSNSSLRASIIESLISLEKTLNLLKNTYSDDKKIKYKKPANN